LYLVGFALIVVVEAAVSGHLLLLPDDPEVVVHGKKIYVRHCAACHGVNLEGEPNWRQRDANGLLPAPPHDAMGHTWHHNDALLFRLTKYGPAKLMGGQYRSAMPAFESVISDADILAVLSYIKSTWPDQIRRTHGGINERAGH